MQTLSDIISDSVDNMLIWRCIASSWNCIRLFNSTCCLFKSSKPVPWLIKVVCWAAKSSSIGLVAGLSVMASEYCAEEKGMDPKCTLKHNRAAS